MIFPTVNLNGTNGEELVGLHLDALADLRKALESIGRAAPHGRDYQTMPDGSFANAMEEHRARYRKVHDVLDELLAIGENIADQLNSKQ